MYGTKSVLCIPFFYSIGKLAFSIKLEYLTNMKLSKHISFTRTKMERKKLGFDKILQLKVL